MLQDKLEAGQAGALEILADLPRENQQIGFGSAAAAGFPDDG